MTDSPTEIPVPRPSIRKSFLFVFLASFLLLSLGTAGVEITRLDVRFAVFVEDMMQEKTGLFPTINGVEYTDYPSLPTIIAYYASFGGRFLNQWTLSLFSLLCGAYTIAMTFLIGERMRRGTGILAASLLLMTMEFMTTLMTFGIDVPVAAAAVTMLYLLERKRNSVWNPAAFAGLLIFAFCVRGPMGLLVLGAAVAGWLFFARAWLQVLIFGATGALVSGFCAWAGYTLIHAQGGGNLWQAFLDWQITSRMASDDLFFYFLDGIAVFAPCTILALAAILPERRHILRSPVFRLAGFWLLPLVLLTIPGCKHLRYMLLTVPAFALAGGYGLRCAAEIPARGTKYLRIFFRVFSMFAVFAVPAAGLVLLIIRTVWDVRGGGTFLSPGIVGMFLFAAVIFLFPKKHGLPHDIARIGILLAILYTAFVFPLMAARETSRKFVTETEKARTGRLYFYRIAPDHEELKYILHVPAEHRGKYLYLRSDSEKYKKMYEQISEPVLPVLVKENDVLVLRDRDLPALEKEAGSAGMRVRVLVSGQLGHRDYYSCALVPLDRDEESEPSGTAF